MVRRPRRTTALTILQAARVEALDRARAILEREGAVLSPVHLMAIAGWILDGRDPLTTWTDAVESAFLPPPPDPPQETR